MWPRRFNLRPRPTNRSRMLMNENSMEEEDDADYIDEALHEDAVSYDDANTDSDSQDDDNGHAELYEYEDHLGSQFLELMNQILLQESVRSRVFDSGEFHDDSPHTHRPNRSTSQSTSFILFL